jgi:uncharacterized protein (TIGR02466 family)
MNLNLFPIKIFKVRYHGDIVSLKDLLLPRLNQCFDITKDNNQGSMRGDGLCSYNTVKNLNCWEELKPIVKFINEQAELYWKELGYAEYMKPGVFEMWANVYKKNSFIEFHNHSPIHMTASFYLQQPSNGGNLIFENPNITLLKHQPYNIDSIRYKSIFEQEIEVTTGDLIIFPGWLTHRTQPNLSNEDRIIIGSNICNVI